jgi:hypothetical protein
MLHRSGITQRNDLQIFSWPSNLRDKMSKAGQEVRLDKKGSKKNLTAVLWSALLLFITLFLQ